MDQVIGFFAHEGVLGIIIIGLIGVITWLQKRIDSKDEQIKELNDKRLLDTNTFTNKYTEVITEVVAAQKDGLNAVNLLKGSVDALANSFQRFLDK